MVLGKLLIYFMAFYATYNLKKLITIYFIHLAKKSKKSYMLKDNFNLFFIKLAFLFWLRVF